MTCEAIEEYIRHTDQWQEREAGERHSATIAEYERETGTNTALLVDVRRHVENLDYELRLATVDSTQHNIEYIYAVETFEDESEALDTTMEFLQHIDAHLDDGSLSTSESTADEIREVIGAFIDEDESGWLDRLADRFTS